LLKVGQGHVPIASNLGDEVICMPWEMVMHGDKMLDMVTEIYGQDYNLSSSGDCFAWESNIDNHK
jgi:hypothetical protein